MEIVEAVFLENDPTKMPRSFFVFTVTEEMNAPANAVKSS